MKRMPQHGSAFVCQKIIHWQIGTLTELGCTLLKTAGLGVSLLGLTESKRLFTRSDHRPRNPRNPFLDAADPLRFLPEYWHMAGHTTPRTKCQSPFLRLSSSSSTVVVTQRVFFNFILHELHGVAAGFPLEQGDLLMEYPCQPIRPRGSYVSLA
eukprot:1913580-Amphidinium_carterae.1